MNSYLLLPLKFINVFSMFPMPLVFLTLSLLLSLSLVLTFFLHHFHRSSTWHCPHVFSLIPLSMLLSPLSLRRPIFHLSFASKLLERIVYTRLLTHISSFPTFSPFQSAYRRFHSTETALLRIHNDLLHAMDSKKLTALVLLDLSAAFDTIDHSILLHRLQTWFGISYTALNFISSYLSNHTQSVLIQSFSSPALSVPTGVPQ